MKNTNVINFTETVLFQNTFSQELIEKYKSREKTTEEAARMVGLEIPKGPRPTLWVMKTIAFPDSAELPVNAFGNSVELYVTCPFVDCACEK